MKLNFIACLFSTIISFNLMGQNNLSDKSLRQALIKQQWRIDESILSINKIDSTFMWSDYEDKEMWKHLDKKTHTNLDGDIKFKKNGELMQLGIYASEKTLTWKVIGSYTVENSKIRFSLINNITAEFTLVKLSKNTFSLKATKK